jgi:general secretion pathway protein K
MNQKHSSRPEERGAVLVIVLWVIALLAMLAVSTGFQAWVEAKLVANDEKQTDYYMLSQAAIEAAKSALKEQVQGYDMLKDPWSNNPGIFKSIDMGEGKLSLKKSLWSADGTRTELYGLEDEESKVNINKASLDCIGRICGIYSNIAPGVIDWRDSNNAETPGGAEEGYYQSLRSPYHCKNAPFESLPELLLVQGVSPEAYSDLAPALTVYGDGKININTAPLRVLNAIGVDSTISELIIRFRKGEDGIEGTLDDRGFKKTSEIVDSLNSFSSLTNDQRGALQKLVGQGLFTVKSNNFMLHIYIYDNHDRLAARYTAVIGTTLKRDAWDIKWLSPA